MNNRIDAVDGLRGIAACIIAFVFHLQNFNSAAPIDAWYLKAQPLNWLHHFGWLAVDLFFVLSGFIMSWKYSSAIKNRTLSAAKFFVLRMSRLYPLHLATLLASILIALVFGPLLYRQDAASFLLNLALAQHWGFQSGFSFNGPAWSISVEVLCYAAFFVGCWFCRSYFPLVAGVGLLIGAIIVKLGLLPLFDVGRGLMGFFAGCLIAMALESGFMGWLRWIALGCLAYFAMKWIQAGQVAVSYLPFCLVILPSLLICVLGFRSLNTALAIRPFLFLGRISYSIYMVHAIIQIIIFGGFRSLNTPIPVGSLALALVYVAAVLGIGIISYFWFELPAQRALRNLYARARCTTIANASRGLVQSRN